MNLNARSFTAIGLMSGTSMDGIDAAVLRTDGERVTAFGAFVGEAYDPAFRAALRGVVGQPDAPGVAAVARELTLRHAAAVRRLLGEAGLAAGDVDVIGFHGHTVFHAPGEGFTRQIGDGALLAAETGIAVIDDFRSRDMTEGGQGAPLAPLFHRALAQGLERPLAVLNLGGVGNVTWIGGAADGPVAFDTGPANALLDDWLRTQAGLDYDADGALAARGEADAAVLAELLADPWFALPPPKSLDRDHFAAAWRRATAGRRLSPADGAATLTGFSAGAVGRAARHLPAPPRRWLATGGGRRNPTLMAALRRTLGVPVDAVEAVGWDGDAIEAQAFAFLAVRSLLGLPLSLPSTTGVTRPCTGGRLHRAGGD